MNRQPLETLDCKTVQEFLIRQQFEKLSHQIEQEIDLHVQKCPACQNFVHLLEQMPDLMIKVDQNEIPSAKIREQVIREARKKRQAALSQKRLVVDRLQLLFNYRIPVYQIMAAALIIFFLNLFIVKLNTLQRENNILPAEKKIEKPASVQERQTSKAIMHLKIVKSKKGGKSLKQDSTYTQFVTFVL